MCASDSRNRAAVPGKAAAFCAVLFLFAIGSCTGMEGPEKDGEGVFTIVECTRVLEYTPAPGQFIGSDSSVLTPGQACTYAEDRLRAGQFVSLGAFGGYIVTEFNRALAPGSYIAIWGNASETSSEPGIIYHMHDSNGNGIPDEEWTEVEGSLHGTDEEESGYAVTYFKPSEIGEDIRWKDSHGKEGCIERNAYHPESSWYPAWIEGDSYTLAGVKLESRARDESGNGTYWVSPSYGSGYADNFNDEEKEFRTRVNDAFGRVVVPRNAVIFRAESPVSFIKVQTAVNDCCGWVGEISTEVCGILGIEVAELE